MLRTTSSIRPRVFISAPIASASRQPMPLHRAARLLPPSFPATATAMTSPQTAQSPALSSRPISVRSPDAAKNSGSSTTAANGSTAPRTAAVSSRAGDSATPAMNAPNSA